MKYQARHRKKVQIEKGKQKIFYRFRWGKLWVLSRPTAKIYVNRDYLGLSMKPPYKIPASSYTIKFHFPNGQIRLQRNVSIKAGMKTTIRQFLKRQNQRSAWVESGLRAWVGMGAARTKAKMSNDRGNPLGLLNLCQGAKKDERCLTKY